VHQLLWYEFRSTIYITLVYTLALPLTRPQNFRNCKLLDRIKLTGFVSSTEFAQYHAALEGSIHA